MSEIFKKQKRIYKVKVNVTKVTSYKKMKAATLKYSGHLQNCPTWQRCASDMNNQTCHTDQTITAPPGKSC